MLLRLILILFLSLVGTAVTANNSKEFQHLLVLGDSITEGYGIEKTKAFPALVESRLQKEGFNIRIINGGVSGSTSASIVSRLRWFLKNKTDVLLLAIGGNDGLRGTDLVNFKKNLQEAIRLAKKNNVRVWLAGMQIPPNYGKEYTHKFSEIYRELSAEENIKLLPFLLEGVAGLPQFNQPDALHPNEEGHKIIAKNVAEFIKKNLKK